MADIAGVTFVEIGRKPEFVADPCRDLLGYEFRLPNVRASLLGCPVQCPVS